LVASAMQIKHTLHLHCIQAAVARESYRSKRLASILASQWSGRQSLFQVQWIFCFLLASSRARLSVTIVLRRRQCLNMQFMNN
jgi:hypothetical protein